MKLIFISDSAESYNYILSQNDNLYEKFKDYFKRNRIIFSEHEAFYLGELEFKNIPPFQISNNDVLNIIKSIGVESKFRKFIKKKQNPAIVLFKKRLYGKTFILGWTHDNLQIDKNGIPKWKRISLNQDLKYHESKVVTRLSPDIYSLNKLAKRTAGYTYPNPLKLLIAGLGSIGSNLTFFLNSLETPDFRLVDPDKLQLENIERHLIGFSYINDYKTTAIKDFILKRRPHQEVESLNKSILDVIQENPDFVNDSDYIFIAIGPGNTQDYLGEAVNNRVIEKPIFFIWVEPYLVGGHCIYLHPESCLDYKRFFDEEGYFKFNIVDSFEYKNGNEQLFMKEAGCQTSYVPFSVSNIILFLSQLFPIIHNIVINKEKKANSYSWFGARNVLQEKNIKISSYGNNHYPGEFIRNSINGNCN